MGGPAYASQQLIQGDVILAVDDQPATDQNTSLLLVGNDKPGSKVVLSIAKAGNKVFKGLLLCAVCLA
jgi:C-terminal processing protease CtpA/Prc